MSVVFIPELWQVTEGVYAEFASIKYGSYFEKMNTTCPNFFSLVLFLYIIYERELNKYWWRQRFMISVLGARRLESPNPTLFVLLP